MSKGGFDQGGGVRRRDFVQGLLLAAGGAAVGTLFPSEADAADRGGAPSAHPYLFFNAGGIEALRRRCDTTMKPQFDALVAYGREHLGDSPPSSLSGGNERRGDAVQDPFLTNILAFSFLGVVTGDERYVDAGKRWALALAAMDDWVGQIDTQPRCANCGYPEGWGLIGLSAAYDWLYHQLDDRSRALLRNKIRTVAKVLHDATFTGEWWTGAYLHHDTWIPFGGLGVGAMSIVDEVPEAREWADRAAHELDGALDWLDSDGGWPEGPCGWAFALISAVPFWDAYRRRFPDRAAAIVDNTWLQNTWKFRLYSRTPDGQFLGFGDCNPHGGYQSTGYQGAPVLRFLAARYRNPYAQWLAAREWEKRPNPFTAVWEILWADPTLDEAPPGDLPHGVRLDNQGMAFFRTGWDPGATVVAFRGTGLLGRRATSLFRGGREAEFNNSTTHAHADGNAFGIWSRGEFAVTLARYGQRESELQNTLLVDGEGQYSRFGADHVGRPDGRITGFFTSRDATFVAGDAARCYPPGLSRFARRLYLVAPGIVFLVDDIAAERPVRLQWRFHVDNGASVEVGSSGFSSVSGGARTVLRLAQPGWVRAGEVSDDWNRGVAFSLDQPTAEAALVAVIVPSLPAGAQAAISAPTGRSFLVEALGARVLAAFSVGDGTLEIPGRMTGHGAAAMVTTGGATPGFFAALATGVSVDGERLLTASQAVTVAYSRTGSTGALTVEAPGGAEITIETGLRVASVRSSDGAGVAFQAEGSRVMLRVPAGTSSYVLGG
jgi:hypothetical protein